MINNILKENKMENQFKTDIYNSIADKEDNDIDYSNIANDATKLSLKKQDILIEQNEQIIYLLMKLTGDVSFNK